jgi:FkbM family methyltransferase
VLYEFGDKQGGYFVEFGAGDGVYLSNTYLLENRFAWRGILAEPNAGFHESLRMRRAIVSEDCVAARSGDIICFNHTADPHLSTIDEFTCADSHATARQSGLRAGVRTVSLNDLLDRHRAPMIIDYLSIDTEGSEMLILESFDFSHRRFALITVEHNFSPSRQAIHDLLSRHGYRRKFEKHSRFDDWYVHDEALATLRLS